MVSQLTFFQAFDPFQASFVLKSCTPEELACLKVEAELWAPFWDIFDALHFHAPWQLTIRDLEQARVEYQGTEDKISHIENGHLPMTRREINDYMARCEMDVAGGFRVMPLTCKQKERLCHQAGLRSGDEGDEFTLPEMDEDDVYWPETGYHTMSDHCLVQQRRVAAFHKATAPDPEAYASAIAEIKAIDALLEQRKHC